MNFRLLFVLLTLIWPLCASANQAASKQSELDALKRRLQTLQQEFRNTQANRKEAADELRQSERAISSAVLQLRELDGARQRTQGELQTLTQQSEATAVRIQQQQESALKSNHTRTSSHDPRAICRKRLKSFTDSLRP